MSANDTFIRALRSMGQVCGVGSEEEEHYISFDDDIHREAKYVVMIHSWVQQHRCQRKCRNYFLHLPQITPSGTPVTLEDS